MDKIRSGSIKKILSHLASLAKDDKEQYQEFWQNFGKVLKEGPAEDFANREDIAKLLRFASTHTDTDVQDVSLAGQDLLRHRGQFCRGKKQPPPGSVPQKGHRGTTDVRAC